MSETINVLNSLKDEVIFVANNTVEMGKMLENLCKYFSTLQEDIFASNLNSMILKDKMDLISQTLANLKALINLLESKTKTNVQDSCHLFDMMKQTKSFQKNDNIESQIVCNVSKKTEKQDDDNCVNYESNSNNFDSDDNVESLDIVNSTAVLFKAEDVGENDLKSMSETKLGWPLEAQVGDITASYKWDQGFTEQSDLNPHTDSHTVTGTKRKGGKVKTDLNTKSSKVTKSKREKVKTAMKSLKCTECNVQFNSKQALSYHLKSSKAHHSKTGSSDGKTSTIIVQKRKSKVCSETSSSGIKTEPGTLAEENHKLPLSTDDVASSTSVEDAASPRNMRLILRKINLEVISDKNLAKDESMDANKPKAAKVNDSKAIQCLKCGKSFKCKYTLKYHMRKHSDSSNKKIKKTGKNCKGGKKFKCSECGYRFATVYNLKYHMLKHCDAASMLNIVNKGTVAGNSNISTSTAAADKASENNEKAKEEDNEKPFQCEKCERRFRHKLDYVRHITSARAHCTPKGPVKCTICGKVFQKKRGLNSHMSYKHVNPERHVVKCQICDKSFPRNSLKPHMRSHTGEKNFPCTLCERRFAFKYSLLQHMDDHTGTNRHVCEICGKGFVRKGNYDYHLTLHDSKSEVVCPTCGKSFTHARNLKTHMVYHTGVKNYTCDICGNEYYHISALLSHKRTHSVERPYPCPECDKCFKCPTSLKSHRRQHTGERPYPCTLCDKRFSCYTGHKQHAIRCRHGLNPQQTTAKDREVEEKWGKKRRGSLPEENHFKSESSTAVKAHVSSCEDDSINSGVNSGAQEGSDCTPTNKTPLVNSDTAVPLINDTNAFVVIDNSFDMTTVSSECNVQGSGEDRCGMLLNGSMDHLNSSHVMAFSDDNHGITAMSSQGKVIL